LIDRCIPVALGARSYEIHVGSGLISSGEAARIVANAVPAHRAVVVTHPALARPYAEPLIAGLQQEGIAATCSAVPPGERFKTLQTVSRLCQAFVNAGLDRSGLVVVVGGGVLGDVAGFAAASYMRGIRCVQVPTTLLAQVDASVGGKTGVDLPQGKNLVGAFHQPRAVVIDARTLATLPARELRSGLAEVIKYGIIYDDRLFETVARTMPDLLRRATIPLSNVIARCCEIKADVVSQDETEQGIRAILNFGHTIGHAIEAITGYRRFKHGEAVSVGMVSACLIGEETGITAKPVTSAVAASLLSARLPIGLPADLDTDAILTAARRDKKVQAGRLRFVLPGRIGSVTVQDNVPDAAIRAALDRQRRLQA
jgi:3-dehydroquinate synthase